MLHVQNKINEAGLLMRDAIFNTSIDWLQSGDCPDALHRYDDDTSTISQCPLKTGVNRDDWPYNHLFVRPDVGALMLVSSNLYCDDFLGTPGFKNKGVWMIYVR